MAISRREFFKRVGVVSAALLPVRYGMGPMLRAAELSYGGRSISRTTGVPRYALPSTCLMCPARCGIVGFVEDDKLVKLEGNPRDPNSRGRLCAKGVAGVQYTYNPDRLLHPLKRAGARGEEKWTRITWEEAYKLLTTKLKEVRERDAQQEFVFMADSEGESPMVTRFLRAFGGATLLNGTALHLANWEKALELSWGVGVEVSDVASAKYILNFGANPYETHPLYVPFIQRLIDARINGAKLVTLDPRVSNTAAKSDEWFILKPGADSLIALAMANVIMQLGLYDRDFLHNWVNLPTRKLAEHLSQYTPEMAESVSGMAARDIRRIAAEFATTRPAVAIAGGGTGKHINGTQTVRAITLLNALTGNLDVKGGQCLPRRYEFAEPDPQPPTPPPSPFSPPQEVIPEIRERKRVVSLLMTYRSNPVFSHPDTYLTGQVLKEEGLIPFYVAIDSFMTESAAMADLVLPAATYLESWDVHSVPAYEMVPFVTLTQPIVPPQGESVPFHDICMQLARRIGGEMEQYFAFRAMKHYIAGLIAQIDGLVRAGGLEYLRENGVWFNATAHPQYRSYEKKGFATPSGKYEVYVQQLREAGSAPLPTYEGVPGHQDLKGGEFILITFQSGIHASSMTANCAWLQEIEHTNSLWMNKDVAQAMGLKRGDVVKVTSRQGAIIVRVHLTNGIHPQVVAIATNHGHWACGRIAQAVPFASADPNTALIWWQRQGNGEHPYPLIPVASDPLGGGQAWQDTKVMVTKIEEG